jgi:type II secretory pathway component GspD/PulD (secretin)
MKTMTALLAMAAAVFAGESREDAMRKLESMKITVDFEDVKLPEALDYLRDVTGLNLVLLPKAMEKDGESKIRLKVKDLSVKSVLKLLIASRGLTATYRDGAIVVLPKEDLQDSTIMKMFDVRSLQVKIQDFPGPLVELTGSNTKKVGTVITSIEEPRTTIPDDFLIDMVKANTGSGSWDSNPKAALNLNNGMLVVSQTPSVLREIESLLGLLGQYQ